MAEAKRWQGKTGGGRFGQMFLIFLFGFVRVSLIYPVLLPVIPFYLIFGKKGRQASYSYFREILGYSRWKATRATVRNYLIFGRVVLDKFAMAAGRSDIFDIEVEGRELFDELLEKPEGCLIAGSHIGNLEIAGNILSQDKKGMLALIYGGERDTLQKKRTENAGQTGMELIPVREDMSHFFALVNGLMDGKVAVVACDRTTGDGRTVKMDFMGHEAEFPLSTFLVAAKLRIPVLSIIVVKEKGLKYRGFVFKLEGSPEESRDAHAKALARDFAKSLETMLARYPHQWFNFYDFWNLKEK